MGRRDGWIGRVRRLAHALDDERGFSLVELSIASGLALIGIMGLSTAMLTGVQAVGVSRQRSTATSIATERVERIKNLPYENVALSTAPAHSTDPDNPDHWVSTNGVDYTSGSTTEPLVVDATQGAVLHIEDPVLSGPSELYVYQYITWVDDPGVTGMQDYKRATVVVTWRRPLGGGSSRVTLSTLLGNGEIAHTFSGPTTTPGPGPSPEPEAAPVPPSSSCVQLPAGTMSIMSGLGADTAYTNSTGIQVRVEGSDPCGEFLTAELSNSTEFTHVATMTLPDPPTGIAVVTVTWTIPAGDGTRTISGRTRNAYGYSPISSGQIILDQTLPTAAGNLRTTSCTLDGNTRTATMTWDPSQDVHLSGHRLYRSINGGDFLLVGGSSTSSFTDDSSKTNQSTRYLVRGYDKAGNESADSNTLIFSKNSC